MEPLLITFIAAALAEVGDKTQLALTALAARHARPAPIILALALGSLAMAFAGAVAGRAIHDLIPLRAISLLLGVALLYAGAMAFFRPRTPDAAKGRLPLFLAALIYILAAEMGDKSQFITAAVAAQYDSLYLAAAGGAAGMFVACVPAALLGSRFGTLAPLRIVRLGTALLFTTSGFVVAVHALRLA